MKLQNKDITTRKALPTDAKDFADLVLLSSSVLFPTIYGDGVKAVMQHLFRQHRNLFSFEHTSFAELDGKKVGMILGYDWHTKKRENWQTGLLLLTQMKAGFISRLPLMLKVGDIIGMVNDKEYYISNIAIHPEYRAGGIGTILILEMEREANRNGAERAALDVEAENSGAIRLYSRLGYSTVNESSVRLSGDKSFHFYRMCKVL